MSLPRGKGAASRREIGSKGKAFISLVKGHLSPRVCHAVVTALLSLVYYREKIEKHIER